MSLLSGSSFSLELLELSHSSLISSESHGTFSGLMLGNEDGVSLAFVAFDHKPIPHFEVVVVVVVVGIDGMKSLLFESIGTAERPGRAIGCVIWSSL